MATMNLVQHRTEASVWDRATGLARWDTERWVLGGIAGALLATGLRHRSPSGLLLVLGGSALAWWAAGGPEERHRQRGHLRRVLPMSGTAQMDPVMEASEESFPASDAPSWTPSTGNIGPANSTRTR